MDEHGSRRIDSVILRKRNPSLREGFPTKDLCIYRRWQQPMLFARAGESRSLHCACFASLRSG